MPTRAGRTALVVGHGSIGARHVRILDELGCSVAVVSRRDVDIPSRHASVGDALRSQDPEYVVVASRTSEHFEVVSQLAQLGYAGTVLVEKPLFERMRPVPEHGFRACHVGYNLRFHPVVQRLRTELSGLEIHSVHAYAGQYLPEWRPGSDYRTSYSAHGDLGGGALRDLSHELDYLTWMLGGWDRVCALGGKVSRLEITSDDSFMMLLETPRCPMVSVALNYLDRRARRFVIANAAGCTVRADLIAGTMTVDGTVDATGDATVEGSEVALTADSDESYRRMHESLLSGRDSVACTFDEGTEVLRLIEAAEASAVDRVWVTR